VNFALLVKAAADSRFKLIQQEAIRRQTVQQRYARKHPQATMASFGTATEPEDAARISLHRADPSRGGTISLARRCFFQLTQCLLRNCEAGEERIMVHVTVFYMVVIVLSVGTVASYVVPLP
jgi:hypothetical protein